MYPKLINFELFYLNGCYNQTQLEEKKLELILKDIDSVESDEIVGLLLTDGFLYANTPSFLKSIDKIIEYSKFKKIKKFTLLTSMCENFTPFLKDNAIDCKVEFFNFSHWMIAKGYEYSPSSNHWNYNSQKFLFLGGVPSRHNRITLLYKLYTAGLLSRAIWSFFPPWTDSDKQWCRSALSACNDTEYEEFINFCDRSIDTLYNEAKEYSKLTGVELIEKDIYNKEYLKNVGYINPIIFKETAISIISEGNAYAAAKDFRFLTEKTWRSVANHHPFILVGYREQVEYAKSLGLKTFEQYFAIPNYYKIVDEVERLEAAVINVKEFLSNYHKRIDDINKDVEHNYQLFVDIFNNSKDLISAYSPEDRKQFFDSSGWSQLIRIPDVE
jgi:hypothetical protein